MTAWYSWTSELARRLSEASGQSVSPSDIVTPPDNKLGDLAFGCFKLAKAMGKSPAAIAQELAGTVDLKNSDFESASAAGPYINFTLSTGESVHRVIRDVEVAGDKYGANNLGEGKEILLECANPNTHKEIHVGHARHLLMGVSLKRILELSDWRVVTMGYHGDVGAHVAKCLWWMIKSGKPREETGEFLGRMYTEATRELDEHPEYKDEISEVQRKLEAHDPELEKLWQETRRWSIDEMTRLFDELSVKLDRQYYESEVTDRGQQMVDALLEKGVAKESQGAIVVDLEDVKLGVFLVRKSDGTSLYGTKDLALAELKLKEYPDAARSIILVDNRQSFYFKQLFETLRRIGLEPVPEHVGYEFVTLKSGAMSSREGNIVTLQSFLNEVQDFARSEVLKRHDDWSEGKVVSTTWAIAMAGIKFGMLRQDSDKVFTFDLEQALSFEGDTGPYCLYAATRLGSIIRKAGPQNPFDGELSRGFDHATEKALALVIAELPSVIALSAKELRPSVIAQWCLKAAQSINGFYRDVPVLESEGDLRDGRIRLATSARNALVLSLNILGITVPEEM